MSHSGPPSRSYEPALIEAWREGVHEFNAQKYWEAHEKWELGWKDLPELERSWVQAWIQLAGALHLKQKGREIAARALCERALFKLGQSRAMSEVLPRIEVVGGVAFLEIGRAPGADSALLEKARKALKAKLLSNSCL